MPQPSTGQDRDHPPSALRPALRLERYLRWLGESMPWWPRLKSFGREFWIFYAASFCFDLGGFVFFVLHNLYLLDCGFSEKTVGLVASAMAIGTVAGTIPAGLLAQRFGLRRTMLLCFAVVPVVSALRSILVMESAQLALAALAGMGMSIWAVCLSPAIAQLSDDSNRPFAFSLVLSSGIGVGVLGGVLGGTMPGLLAKILPSASAGYTLKAALLTASGLIAVGLWPTSNLRSLSAAVRDQKIYPRHRFLLRFLPAIGVWSLVTGSFGPFVNVYFSQYLHLPLPRIGLVMSAAQLSQVVAILFAPLIYRRFGLVTGIMYTQLATAAALGCLAAVPVASAAAVIYTGYMAAQWMSEPGMFSLLMGAVSPSERSGASALNFFVISLACAIAAAAAGQGFARLGYPVVIGLMAVLAVIAALLFRGLLGDSAGTAPASAPPAVQAANPG